MREVRGEQKAARKAPRQRATTVCEICVYPQVCVIQVGLVVADDCGE